MENELVFAMRRAGVDVLIPSEAGLMCETEETHLTFAFESGRVLYSFNVADFYRIHSEWSVANRPHAGIIIGRQQRYSVGEQMRRILLVRAEVGSEGMRSRIEFLSNWG